MPFRLNLDRIVKDENICGKDNLLLIHGIDAYTYICIDNRHTKVMNLESVFGCYNFFNEMKEQNDIHIVCIMANSGITSYCRAMELAKYGTINIFPGSNFYVKYLQTFIYNCSLQPFSQDYGLFSHNTYDVWVFIFFMHR